jgi:hypothetical protein
MELRSLLSRLHRPSEGGAGEEPTPVAEAAESAEADTGENLAVAPEPESEPAPTEPAPRGRLGRFFSRRREPAADTGFRPLRPPAPNLALVRRERRALVSERERRVRDLGGLLLEMYRRDQFREDLLLEHCAQAMSIENRIHELDAILARSALTRRGAPGPRCACGAPLLFGARFCASCGRPTELALSGAICARCGQPLAAEAQFCAGCGAASSKESPAVGEETIIHTLPESEEKGDSGLSLSHGDE